MTLKFFVSKGSGNDNMNYNICREQRHNSHVQLLEKNQKTCVQIIDRDFGDQDLETSIFALLISFYCGIFLFPKYRDKNK